MSLRRQILAFGIAAVVAAGLVWLVSIRTRPRRSHVYPTGEEV